MGEEIFYFLKLGHRIRIVDLRFFKIDGEKEYVINKNEIISKLAVLGLVRSRYWLLSLPVFSGVLKSH